MLREFLPDAEAIETLRGIEKRGRRALERFISTETKLKG